jgi:hypothetical protein
MFCALRLVFDGSGGVRSSLQVLRSRSRFRRFRGRRVQFSCFVLPNSFSTEPWASCPVFMFCAPGLVFGDTVGVGSSFHVLHSETRFRRYRGRWVSFSCFALSYSFSTIEGVSSPVFMFCAPDSFSAVPRASGPVLMFCAHGLVFGGSEGVMSNFHILRSRTGFSGTVCVGSLFLVLRSRTHFRRYRGRRVPFSYFALPDSFSSVPKVSSPVFMLSYLLYSLAKPKSFYQLTKFNGKFPTIVIVY